jgi:hypothetical protein
MLLILIKPPINKGALFIGLVIPLPKRLEPMGNHKAVWFQSENPAVGAGLQHILATIGDGSARERKVFHIIFSMLRLCGTRKPQQK